MNHRLSACLATAVLLGACSTSGSGDAAPPSTTADSTTTSSSTTEATTTTAQAEDPTEPAAADCPSADDVAGVVGAEVDRSQSGGITGSTDGLSYSTRGCSYDLGDDAGSVSISRITAEDDSGDEPFYLRLEAKAETDALTDGFEPVADVGDDAYRDGTDIVVKYGERIMFVGFSSFDDVDDQELTDRVDVATTLADNLVPLDLDQDAARACTAIEDLADRTVGTVSSTGPSSKSTGIGDVSISGEGCVLDLQDGRKLSVSVAEADQWDEWVKAKQSSTFTNSFTLASLGELSAYDTGEALIVNEGEEPLEVATNDLDLDADAAADLRMELARLTLGR